MGLQSEELRRLEIGFEVVDNHFQLFVEVWQRVDFCCQAYGLQAAILFNSFTKLFELSLNLCSKAWQQTPVCGQSTAVVHVTSYSI